MRSSRPHLEKVINAGVRTVIYDGDADYVCNYQGVENMVNALHHKYSSQFASTSWTSWSIDGVRTGQFKNAGSFSYVRIFQSVSHFGASQSQTHIVVPRAGHLVPAFTVGNLPLGKHALTMFNQAMSGQPISSTY